MDVAGKDHLPTLSATNWPSDRHEYNSNRSVSISMTTIELNSNAQNGVEQEQIKHQRQEDDDDDEVKNKHLSRSGQLGMCNDPYCTTCPTSYNHEGKLLISRLHVYGGVKGWVRKKLSLIKQVTFGVMNPHAKAVKRWNQFIVISCLIAIFVDPLFFYLLSVNKDKKCIVINWPMTKTILVFRSMTDLIYFLHMLVQFRLAFISPESRVVGAGDLVDNPRKIALHYLSGFFFLDLFIVLPLPQIIILSILPHSLASSGANYAKNFLRTAILFQYIPRLYRFLPLLAGQSPSGFIFESAWANFVINLLTFVLAGHVVGSCWYLFGLQRVNHCLGHACRKSGIINCKKFADCGHGNDFGGFEMDPTWNDWKQNENATACFSQDGYGIYEQAVNLTAERSIITRYVYSFFWGFQVPLTF